ncbi:hypothetical protein [Micromonospora sp. NPDC049679]|uniref:hypothetical protein n=1 Tax=Micromonospora sp. NPDC049679 TaxID=3155920 RepID=UPI0033E7DB9E
MSSTALRAAVLGAATGGRSMTGLSAVALTTPPGTRPTWVARLGGPWGRRVTAMAAAGEMLADKTPRVPSRLAPPVLAERIIMGVVSAAALARRDGVRPALPVVFAVAAVVGASLAGVRWRTYAQRRGWGMAGAVAEDVLTVGLAAAACTLGRRR